MVWKEQYTMLKAETAEDVFIDLVRAVLNGEKPSPLPAGISADEVYQIGMRQGMVPIVYCALSAMDPKPESKNWSKWQQSFLSDCQRSEIQMEESSRLISFLCARGVKILPLKGYVIRSLYPSPYLRVMNDVDLMYEGIRTEDLAVLMQEAGYSPESLETGCHDTFHKKPCMKVELHRKLLHDYDPAKGILQNVFADAEPDADIPNLYHIKPEDLYIHVISHAACHFRSSGIGIRPIADIYLLNHAYNDTWDRGYIGRQLQSGRLDRFEAKMRVIAETFFGKEEMNIPKRDILFLFRGGTYGKASDVAWKFKGQNRMHFMLSIIFPSYAYMHEMFPSQAKHPVLLPFAWIYRIFDVLLHRRQKIKRIKSTEVNSEKAQYRNEIMADFGLDI